MPTHADLNRRRPVSLSPWVRAIVGDESAVDLPDGYTITGLARSPRGPVSLALHRDGTYLVERVCSAHDAVTVLGALVDLAYIDARERTVVVTTDGAGWVRSIEDVA